MYRVFGFVIAIFFPIVVQAMVMDFTPIEKDYIKNHKTVSVAVLTENWSPYIVKVAVNDYNGIHIDYIKNISEIIGVDIKFHSFDTVEELLESVKSGKSDMAVGFSQTLERSKSFIASIPYFRGSVAVWYRKPRAAYLPIEELSWSCVTGTIYCDRLDENGAINIYKKDNFDDAIDLVNNGKADAIIANYVTIAEYLNDEDIIKGTTQIPGWLEPESTGILSSKENQIFIDIINKVVIAKRKGTIQDSIESNNIYHQSDLLNLAYRNMETEEQAIRYSLKEDSYPLFYRNEDGEITGYLYDFIKLIQARTGLKFKYVENEGGTAWESLSKGDIDLIPLAYPRDGKSQNVTLSRPYMSIVYRSIEKKNNVKENKKSGVLIDLNNTKIDLIRSKSTYDIEAYDDVKSLLDDLEQDIIDRIYLPSDLVQGVIAKDFTDHFIVGKSQDRIIDISFAVSNNNKLLSNVINAVLTTVDHEELRKLKRGYRNFNVIYGYEKSRVFKVIILLFFAIFLVFLVIYFWLKNLKLQVKLKEIDVKQSESDKKWLQSIINELPSIIFIQDEKNKILLSNCIQFKNSKCVNCVFFNKNNLDFDLNDNNKVMEGSTANDFLYQKDCNIGFEKVERVRKCIMMPSNHNKFMLTVIHDITEQKKQEADLIAANDAAQNAIISRERFLASMSHELRTPIAGVTGLLELLSKRVNGIEKEGLVDSISSSMRHLHLLVNDILDFSKLEAQQLSLELRECYYLRELGNVFRLHNAAALDKGLSLYIYIVPNHIEMIKIDSLRLNQIINNLLSNAIKFTEKGHVNIYVEFIDNMLNLRICDTGLGMNNSQLESVFEPFTQADNSIARKYGGSGLGLNIVNELVKLMDGTFTINSILGVGTSVDLSIPIEISTYFSQQLKSLNIECSVDDESIFNWINLWTNYRENNECISKKSVIIVDENNFTGGENDSVIILTNGTKKETKKSIDGVISISSSPLFIDELYYALLDIVTGEHNVSSGVLSSLDGCVLIAEDNKINQILLVKQLEEFGVSSVVTNNGQEALEKLLKNPGKYDALITDCHMPILDGFTLAERVRKDIPEFSNKAIIGCTAEDLRISRLNGNTSGFDDMLFKPYGIEVLHSVLNTRLNFNIRKEGHHLDNDVLLKKIIEIDSNGLIDLFIETMSEDYESLISAVSSNDVNLILHQIKGGAGSVGLQSLVLFVNDVSNYSFGSDKYNNALNVLTCNIELIIKETSRWHKSKYD